MKENILILVNSFISCSKNQYFKTQLINTEHRTQNTDTEHRTQTHVKNGLLYNQNATSNTCYFIFCNDIIFHWRKVNLQICEIYNGREKQTITHLLYSCPTVKHIWRLLEDWCSELDLPYEVNFVNILYNLIQPKPEHVVNLTSSLCL